MTASKIHEGLDKSEIRDFLSKSMVDILHQEADSSKVKRTPAFNREDPMQWAIDQANAEIDFWKFQLEKAIAKKSVIQLIKMNGWEEHDISDYISLENGKRFCPTFIGTDEEFKKLLEKLKGNE